MPIPAISEFTILGNAGIVPSQATIAIAGSSGSYDWSNHAGSMDNQGQEEIVTLTLTDANNNVQSINVTISSNIDGGALAQAFEDYATNNPDALGPYQLMVDGANGP